MAKIYHHTTQNVASLEYLPKNYSFPSCTYKFKYPASTNCATNMNLKIKLNKMFRNKTERGEAFHVRCTATKTIEFNASNKNWLILHQTPNEHCQRDEL